MDSFSENLLLGVWHILDFNAYDHMLFLLALCAVYDFKHVKQVIFLATAFTIGHSLTLIVSGLDLFRMKSSIVEFLIPVTIVISAIANLVTRNNLVIRWKYIVVGCFGLIHGLGFSSFFRMMSNDESIVLDLLAFNLGVEVGQIVIVLGILLLSALFVRVLSVSQRDWVIGVSCVALGAALVLTHQTWPF